MIDEKNLWIIHYPILFLSPRQNLLCYWWMNIKCRTKTFLMSSFLSFFLFFSSSLFSLILPLFHTSSLFLFYLAFFFFKFLYLAFFFLLILLFLKNIFPIFFFSLSFFFHIISTFHFFFLFSFLETFYGLSFYQIVSCLFFSFPICFFF